MALLNLATAYTKSFFMTLSSDHITGATGKTVVVTISKAGAAFGAAAGAVSEIGNGWYKCAYSTVDTGTAGDLAMHATNADCDPTDAIDQIGAIVASVSGAVGSVTGSVASVTALAAGAIAAASIATGAITAAKFAAGAIDAAAIATDAIDADSLKADAVTEIAAGRTGSSGVIPSAVA